MTWQWRKFKNPAREDGLELEHWVKCYQDPMGKIKPAEDGEYRFAKYNKQVRLLCGLFVMTDTPVHPMPIYAPKPIEGRLKSL